jgi:penicillin-binding protein 2
MNDNRRFYVKTFFVFIALAYLVKLFIIQVLDDNYATAAERYSVKRFIEYPYRGLIYDRNGKLIVYNKPVFDIQVVPREVYIPDTAEFCKLFGITREQLQQKLDTARSYSRFKPSDFMKQMPIEQLAQIQDHLIDYRGFTITPRTIRSYPYRSMANALGYIAEISRHELNNDHEKYYRMGDYVGKSGIEYSYEKELRGQRGVKHVMVNRFGVEKGSFKNGQYDTMSIPGKNLIATIDIELQNYVEKLLDGKVGGVVAIEPRTGEILALATAPHYDPNILTGRDFGKNFGKLVRDSLSPLFTRPLMAMYAPGSMFKSIQSLIFLQEGVVKADENVFCERGLIGDFAPVGHYNVARSIQLSSNTYYYKVFRRMLNQGFSRNTFVDTRIGYERWREHLLAFGLGSPLAIDIPNSTGGFVPPPTYYDRIYGRDRWRFSTIYSLSIGQGELLITPLQMANLAAIIANRGYYYIPHIIKSIGNDGQPLEKYREKIIVPIDPKHFEPVIEGMEAVIQAGTGQYRAKLRNISVCGKTSTVENPHGEDHSGFFAFAPKDNPQIAVAAYVENAGQGARAAASIASLTIEKYLLGKTERPHIEQYVLRGIFK